MRLARWFKGVRGRLLMLVAIPVLLTGGLGASALYGMKTLTGITDEFAQSRIPTTMTIGNLRTAGAQTMVYLLASHAYVNDPKGRAGTIEWAREQIKHFDTEFERLKGSNLSPQAYQSLDKVAAYWKTLNDNYGKAIALMEKNTPEADVEAKKYVMDLSAGPATAMIGELGTVSDLITESNFDLAMTARSESEEHSLQVIIGIAIGISILIAVGIWIASALAKALGGVSQGISGAGAQVDSGSQQLSTASQQLSSGATQAAGSLEETVSSLEELSSMVKRNADHAKEAASLSKASRDAAESGEERLQGLVQAMGEISQSSRKIEEIINVIDDIAFQTNLLALNAAVEAARAGEQGRGFAVVADAVRTLAQRSSVAAKDITTLIKDSVDKIERGTQMADQSGESLKMIVTSVRKASDLVDEISVASQEQATGINQISRAMTQLDQATQSNAAAAEEVASSSQEMANQAVNLKDLVGRLIYVVEGVNSLPQDDVRAPSSSSKGKRQGPAAKVLPMEKKVVAATSAQDMIPFDGDESSGKVGTTDGF